MGKSLDEIAAIEKAISKKYGKETIQDPRSLWDEEKEAEYIEQVKIASAKRERVKTQRERVEIDGVFVSRKLLNKERDSRTCSVCEKYTFMPSDDVFMTKYKCCLDCWGKHIEGREERWKKGWRPSDET